MNRNSKSDLLFSDFDQKSKKDWIEGVIEDLKGADFNKLVWKVTDGFDLDPFYTAEDIYKLKYLNSFHNLLLNTKDPQVGPRKWLNIEKILVFNEKKSNSLAHDALRMGADGIHFLLPENKKVNIEVLLNQLLPNKNPIKFEFRSSPKELVHKYLTFISARADTILNNIGGGIDFDPIKKLSITGKLTKTDFDILTSLINSTERLKEFKILTLNADHFLNSGANTVQEIAFIMNSLVEYIDHLTEAGLSLKKIIQNLELSVSIGTNYFVEIAKVRAIRVLLYHILETYQIDPSESCNIKIHCNTSQWTKTIYDPYVNMLRNTTEAMSALIGGANSISITPFDEVFSKPNDFSRRISRNVSSLLKEESYFDKVADPVAGSYYLEILTDKLINKSLDIFKEIESAGGYYQAFKKGLIQKKINQARNKKHELAADRRKVIVGTNQYSNPLEKMDLSEIKFKSPDFSLSEKRLIVSRASINFEKLRLETDRYVQENGENKRPKVFLSLIGENQVMRKTRSSFAMGFFEAAGFSIIESSPSSTLFESIEKAIESKADIVVMCGSDEDYISSGKEYARAFKSNNVGLLVMAGNPEEIKSELIAAGVDDFIHIKTNLIDSLYNIQNKLKIREA